MKRTKTHYFCAIAGLLPLSCSGGSAPESTAKTDQRIVLNEACGPNSTSGPEHDPCTITRTQTDPFTIETKISEPVVDRPSYDYTTVVLNPGDSFTIDASGCVQTGGVGSTWKRYVNPSGDNSDHLYFGLIEVPGFLTQRRVSDVIGQTFTLDMNAPQTFLRLGYPDDEYDDDGYWGHDDGTEDQCSFANGNDGGPAHLTITITSSKPIVPDPVRPQPQGEVPPMGQPWDVIPNLVDGQRAQLDDNLFFFNPRFQWQEPGGAMPDFDTSLSSQMITFDDAEGSVFNNIAVCGGACGIVCGVACGPLCASVCGTGCGALCGSGVVDYKQILCGSQPGPRAGHANWFDGTLKGDIFWDHHDGGIGGDDDYNVKITTPQITGAQQNDTLALVATGDDPAPGVTGSVKLIKGEFDSDETVDYDEFDQVPWWRDFHSAVDDSDDSARAMINGHTAVMLGLIGLDLVHGTQSEIHPVHALAIRQTATSNVGDDAWSIFVRNFGDEGYCSSNQHYLTASTITIRLPRPDGIDPSLQASGLLSLTKFVGHNTTQVGPEVFTAPNQDTLVTFHLNDGGFVADEDNFSFVVGELHLHWDTTGTQTQASPISAAPVTPPADDNGDVEPEDMLSAAVEALSPAQFQAYQTASTTPLQPSGGVTVPLAAALVTTPPPLATEAPGSATGLATHKTFRDLARFTALCVASSGAPQGLGTACQVIPPQTTSSVTPTATVTNCFAAPQLVKLTASDASGTGIDHIEYSFDGTNFVKYTGPFLATQGTVIAYRAKDHAGNLEQTNTLTVTGDSSGFAQRDAVFAGNSLLIDDSVVVTSAQSGGSADLVNAGPAQTNIGSAASVSNVTSRGLITLRDRAHVNGNIVTSQASITKQNGIVITGTVTTKATLTLPSLSSCAISFPTLGAPVTVAPGASATLAPGAYGDTSIQSRATLKLSSGTYYLASIDLEPQARIVLDQTAGPVVLVVKNSIIERGQFVSPSGAPASVLLFYSGTNAARLETAFQGTVIAPNAFLGLAASGVTYAGSFFAKDVEVSPQISLKH
jgi:hypothetical protein